MERVKLTPVKKVSNQVTTYIVKKMIELNE